MAVNARKLRRPWEWYEPSEPNKVMPDGRVLSQFANQLGFHQAPHIIRGLFPGNGWGKSIAVAAELNAWGYHTNQWQRTPAWPVIMLWVFTTSDQFAMIYEQVRTVVFGTDVKYKAGDGEFVWPDGSKMFLAFANDSRSWEKRQGIAADLIAFDEEPPVQFWREMMMRRRAQRKTRYIVAATATKGDSWMAEEIYKPWAEHHKTLGLDPTRALWAQKHADIWLWWRGGVNDNPGADESDLRWYEGRTWSSEKEREVRLTGGFQSWTGDPVFDPAAIARMMARLEESEKRTGPGRIGQMMGVTTH